MTSDDQMAVLTKHFSGFGVMEISQALGLSPISIRRLIKRTKAVEPPKQPDEVEVEDSRGGWIDAAAQDRKFKRAMCRALRAGLEQGVIGVIKNHTPPPVATKFYTAVRHSGCSSAAGLCAEYGSNVDWG